MVPDVSCEVGESREGFFANVAREFFSVGVRKAVLSEVFLAGEASVALRALEREIACVDLVVSYERMLDGEFFIAFVTLEWFFLRVVGNIVPS